MPARSFTDYMETLNWHVEKVLKLGQMTEGARTEYVDAMTHGEPLEKCDKLGAQYDNLEKQLNTAKDGLKEYVEDNKQWETQRNDKNASADFRQELRKSEEQLQAVGHAAWEVATTAHAAWDLAHGHINGVLKGLGFEKAAEFLHERGGQLAEAAGQWVNEKLGGMTPEQREREVLLAPVAPDMNRPQADPLTEYKSEIREALAAGGKDMVAVERAASEKLYAQITGKSAEEMSPDALKDSVATAVENRFGEDARRNYEQVHQYLQPGPGIGP